MEEICAHPQKYEHNINENMRRNGERVFVSWTNKVEFDEHHHIRGILSIGSDVTERKRMEAAMRQSEKMSAVGQLAAGVAHELNNPLGVILGFAEASVRRMPASDALAPALKSIEREAYRCQALVKNLLVFSREKTPGLAPVDLIPVVEDALTLIEAQARVKKVEVVRQLAAAVPPVLADRQQVQQVLINLCNNGMDAMPQGGILTISLEPQDGGVVLSVRDTGTGIPLEARDRIFDPFFTTKEIGKGTGLGLSLVYEIIKKHDGEITFESELNHGTTFHVRFPLQRKV
jgi:signal transduction histidine kinase